MKSGLTIAKLKFEAGTFSRSESSQKIPELYNVNDGKSVGTHLEHKFQEYLSERYFYEKGSSAKGIDFPELKIDMKVTSITQPQSSCPFESARQKVYGLGYHLIVFVYNKVDDHVDQTGRLDIRHTLFLHEEKTGDYQTTKGLSELLDRDGNKEDIMAFFSDRNLPLDEIAAGQLADEVLKKRPKVGCLTISNALQWRLQYSRAIELAGAIDGVLRIG